MSDTMYRTRPTEPAAGSNSPGAAPAHALEPVGPDTLPQIAQDISEFFSDWSSRMQQLLERCRDVAEREEDVHRAQEDLQQQRCAWEAQRQREDEEIYDTVQQLTDAWLRLESEQRALLQAHESLQQRSQNQDVALRTLTRDEGRMVAQRAGRQEKRKDDSSNRQEPASLSRQMAVQQFERLKRELNHHMQGDG